jgi:hypothetical protein
LEHGTLVRIQASQPEKEALSYQRSDRWLIADR